MSLGIFNRLFNLLEEECQLLNLELASRESGGVGGVTFREHIQALKHLTHLKDAFQAAQQSATLNAQLSTHFLLTLPGAEQNHIVQQVQQEGSAAKRQVATLVRECTTITQ